MKSRHHFWKQLTADWKVAVLLALPMFAAAMWFGVSRGYADLGLYSIVMALGTLHVAEMAIITARRFREWRSRGGRDA